MTDAPTLKPCPFCGTSHSLLTEHMEGTILHPAYRIRCDYCGASINYSDRGNHVETWNRRAIPADDAEMVDRLAQALHFDFCEDQGWPNGQPAWDEMPDESAMGRAADTLAKAYWRSQARAALSAMRGEP